MSGESIFQHSEKTESLEKITKALTDFFKNDDNIQFKTDLSKNQIKDIIRLEYLDKIFKNEYDIVLELADKLTIPFKEHLVSKNRKGREEFFKAIESLLSVEQKKESGLMKKLGL